MSERIPSRGLGFTLWQGTSCGWTGTSTSVPLRNVANGLRTRNRSKSVASLMMSFAGEGSSVLCGSLRPSSTTNADKASDPEMHQARKGNQW